MSIKHHLQKPTLESIISDLERSRANEKERNQRIADCVVEDTDCALSMWASNATLDRLGKMLDLAKADWKAVFPVLHRVSDGTPVKGKVWRGPDKFKYGAETVRWLIDGEWMTAYPSHGLTPRREANLKAKGFMWKDMVLPAHVAQSFGNYLGAPVHTFIIADFTDYIL